jgi:acetyltransferase-like isoleucine patch superfamily enzyme
MLAWLLPSSPLKLRLLRMLGHDIAESAIVGPTLVLGCGRFSVGAGSVIDPFNLFKSLSRVKLGEQVRMGRFNQVSAARGFQQYSPRVGAFIVGDEVTITNRHYFDCSGQVVLRNHTAIGGIRTIVQSHEFDLGGSVSRVDVTEVGEFTMLGTRCLVLMGARLPSHSVFAAGSVVPRTRDGVDQPSGLYGGVPATHRTDIGELGWYNDRRVVRDVTEFDDSTFLDPDE